MSMYKGIYIALSGALSKQSYMDIIAHNLANTNTIGYKKERISFKDSIVSELNTMNQGADGRTMSDLSTTVIDFAGGNLIKTRNPLDIAVEGEGFISLEGNRYTRRGDLRISSDGYIVNYQGLKVLGNNGAVRLQGKGAIEINTKGTVLINGAVIDTLRIMNFKNLDDLKKAGNDVFISEQPGIESKGEVRQGHLEASNVEAVREMVQMLVTMREFEAYQKAIQAFDEAASKAANEMGRI